MQTSAQWHQYFQQNAQSLLEIPWHRGGELTPDESAAVAASIQGFQAGESSEGRHLYKYAKQYSERTGDTQYLEAMRLFIAEEQRHGRDLGRFLKLNHIPLLKTTFPDRVFRRLRNLFGGLEMSIAVLVTAEIFAMVYYAALRAATDSQILQRLCDQILRDEVQHLEFQCQQLGRLRFGRSPILAALTMASQRFLFLGTVFVVWFFHRKAIKKGRYHFRRFWRASWMEFNDAFAITRATIATLSEQRTNAALHKTPIPAQAASERR